MPRCWSGAILLGVLAGALAGAAFAGAGKPKITSVSFAGSEGSPRFVIHGANFGRLPAARGGPTSSAACRSDGAQGNQGRNYAAKLFFIDNTNSFSGGLSGPYHGVANVVDCVGLIVTAYTPERVAFSLGSDYRKHPYSIRQGDKVLFVVAGAKATVTVRYGHTVANPTG